MPSDRVPAASDFSPGILDGCIKRVLEVVAAHGDKKARRDALKLRFFSGTPTSQQDGRANNVLISLPCYELADSDGQPTSLGERLRNLTDDEADLEFARHCLTELAGIDVLRAVRDLQERGEKATKESIAATLENSYGMRLSRNTTDHLTLLNWMRRGGVLQGTSGYSIDEALVQRLSGVSLSDLDAWQQLDYPQRAFLTSLHRLTPSLGVSLTEKQVKADAETMFGDSLYASSATRAKVIVPLEKAGWLTSSGGTTGRGAKSGSVSATSRLLDLDLSKMLGYRVPTVPPDLRKQMNKPLTDIFKELKSSDTFLAGIALELLALRMAMSLGLTPVDLRKRDDKTGGGEVDLVAEGAHLHFSRWLFQCKNQKAPVSLGVLAKEVGMAVLLKAQVIVIATTGSIGGTVVDHAKQVAETTGMQVVLVDSKAVRAYLSGGDARIQEHFHTRAVETLKVKSVQRATASG